MKDSNVMVNRKTIYDHLIDYNTKQYKEIRKLTKNKGKNYKTGCLLDYMKNHYKLIAVNSSRQNELDVNQK